jgi:hypothetical protein
VRDEAGTFLGYAKVTRDLTEVRVGEDLLAMQRAQEAMKVRDQFIADVAPPLRASEVALAGGFSADTACRFGTALSSRQPSSVGARRKPPPNRCRGANGSRLARGEPPSLVRRVPSRGPGPLERPD